jgi:hypothetical protein
VIHEGELQAAAEKQRKEEVIQRCGSLLDQTCPSGASPYCGELHQAQYNKCVARGNELAEKRADQEIADVIQKEKDWLAEADRVPAGWIKCACPEEHSGLGKWVHGVYWHPAGAECP